MINATPKKRRRKLALCLSLASAALILLMYLLFIFANIPPLRILRDLYVETAMTTGDHQWLATAIIPQGIIDEIMSKRVTNPDVIGGLEPHPGDKTSEPAANPETNPPETTPETDPPETPIETTPETTPHPPAVTPTKPEFDPYDIFSPDYPLEAGDLDYAGNKIETFDRDEALMISHIKGEGYRGYVMLIDDPSRVFLGTTPYKNKEGLRMPAMLEHYDAVAGINASGFADPGGNGTGGYVMGLSCSGGEYWGSYMNYYGSVIFTEDDRLVVGNVKIWSEHNIRDGIQFGPVLVANGRAQVEGSAGWGIQPRTAIGQRADGVIIMLVIDGRDVSWSLGCTVGQLAEIMLDYGAINASCCDGGSSTVLAYEGEVINRNCSANPDYGRRLPNAFLVKRK